MQKFEVFEQHHWKPLEKLGFTHSFWSITFKTVFYTWIVIAVLLVIALACRYFLTKKDNAFGFLILSFIKSFNELITQTLGTYSFTHFAFITSLFIFILTNNIISLIPGMEEPTANVNTTLSLGIIAFLYVQISSIKSNGLKGYIKEYFSPFFILFPLNIIGELAKIISMSFRLFGNIFGGSIISKLWLSSISGSLMTEILGILTGVNLIIVLFFILFEGFIQAFVFSMLTLTYLSVAISKEENHGELKA